MPVCRLLIKEGADLLHQSRTGNDFFTLLSAVVAERQTHALALFTQILTQYPQTIACSIYRKSQ